MGLSLGPPLPSMSGYDGISPAQMSWFSISGWSSLRPQTHIYSGKGHDSWE